MFVWWNGKLKDNLDVAPKQQPHRRIPFHVRADVQKELERLESLDIIEKAEGPTPWVSPVVVVPKQSGTLRICVDMREDNKAIKRERHVIPTTDDLIAGLNGATLNIQQVGPLIGIPSTRALSRKPSHHHL